MKLRKIYIGLLVSLLSTLAVGCSGQAEIETFPPETSVQETTVPETETTEETTPAPTEPPFRTPAEIRVGLILYGEEEAPSMLTSSVSLGLQGAAAEIGMSEDQILVRYHNEESGWTEIEDSLVWFVESGCQLVIGGSREYEAVIAAVAEAYPEVMFSCVGSSLMNGKNSGTFDIRTAYAHYLCGAMAGLETTTGHVGFVAAKGSSHEIVTEAVNAFAYGVWTVNREATVEVAVLEEWYLPGAEEAAVSHLDSLSCDVIEGYTDGMLGRAGYDWQLYFEEKLSQVIDKDVMGEAWLGDYFDGAVFCQLVEELPDPVWRQLEQWDVPVDEIPEIKMNKDTGYLTNVRHHKIHWEESKE